MCRFTLAELLVVSAIIRVPVALLLTAVHAGPLAPSRPNRWRVIFATGFRSNLDAADVHSTDVRSSSICRGAFKRAISDKSLSCDLAANLFNVDDTVRDEVGRRIVAGEPAAAVVRELAPKKRRAECQLTALERLLAELDRATVSLRGKTGDVCTHYRQYAEAIRAGQQLIEHLLCDVQLE